MGRTRYRGVSAPVGSPWRGRGGHGKTTVVGVKDRDTNQVHAEVVEKADARMLQRFVATDTIPTAIVYTDQAAAYRGLPFPHQSVRQSGGEYFRGDAHTNGIESFWAVLKRAYKGAFHQVSRKHLARCVRQFVGKHNMRSASTRDRMPLMVFGMDGRRLTYQQLIA